MRARCSGRMVCIDMTIEPVGGGTKSFGLCSESYQTKKGAASIATFVLATDFVTGVGLAVIKLRLNSDQVLRSVPLTLDGRRSVALMGKHMSHSRTHVFTRKNDGSCRSSRPCTGMISNWLLQSAVPRIKCSHNLS